jgi:hypothetical protein
VSILCIPDRGEKDYVPSVLKTLQRELRGRYGRLPIWPPGSAMALGDVGRLSANGWVKATTLDALGIAAVADEPGAPADLESSRPASPVSTRWKSASRRHRFGSRIGRSSPNCLSVARAAY